jgi:UDP:flavonoid glycosyltransferase YjiC (YdhE family)
MRFLFVSAQVPGHLDWGGYLPTAAELARRGHEVVWASGPEVAPLVAAQGLPFRSLVTGWRWPPPPPLPPEDVSADAASPEVYVRQKQVRALDQWLDVERVTQATTALVELGAELRPDLLVSEMFVAAAGLAAEALNIPLAVAGWPAAPLQAGDSGQGSELVRLGREWLAQVLERFGLRGVNWTQAGPPALRSPHLHLTYWSERWFGGAPFGAQTRHVGGRRVPGDHLPGSSELPGKLKLEGAPWVFITLGTSFNADPNFFIAASQAAVQIGCVPIVAVGTSLEKPWVAEMRARLPAAAILCEQVDYAALFPHVAAAIHHGGAGTTHALIVHGAPQVIVPHAGDQMRQAQGVTRTGVGLAIKPKAVSVPVLVDALAALLPDLSPYRSQAQTLQEEFAALGGVPAAADYLLTLRVLRG